MARIFYYSYSLLSTGLSSVALPGFWLYARFTGRYKKHFKERLGRVPLMPGQNRGDLPMVWIHAASLGEVGVAGSIIEALLNGGTVCRLTVSTMTEHGRDLALKTFGGKAAVIYAPFDSPATVKGSLARIRPDILVFLETELWPSWLFEAKRRGVRLCLLNGRISERSIKGYLKVRPFFKEVLNCFDRFSMITSKDAARMMQMGADPSRITVNGNAKYDTLMTNADGSTEQEMRKILQIRETDQVFVAGSTRGGEEEQVLTAYRRVLKDFPNTILIIAPRHINRAASIVSLMERNGFPCRLRTSLEKDKGPRTEKIIVVDTFGELFKVYGVATAVFCGASLVPLGGQNPMEPAAWGKAVLYGPSMEDFLDAKHLLEAAGAALPVVSGEDLGEKIAWLFAREETLKAYGSRARTAVQNNCRTAEKHAEVIAELLKN